MDNIESDNDDNEKVIDNFLDISTLMEEIVESNEYQTIDIKKG